MTHTNITQKEIKQFFNDLGPPKGIKIYTGAYGMDEFDFVMYIKSGVCKSVIVLSKKLPRFVKKLKTIKKSKYTGRYYKLLN